MANRSSDPVVRRAHTVPTHIGLRRHRRDVARWALSHGHPVDRDALAAIVGVRAAMSDGTVSLHWTAVDVGALLWSGVNGWCLAHGVRPPVQTAPTLATYLRYLSAHRLMQTGSDSMTVLRRALATHDPGDEDDTSDARSRHPASGRRSLAPVLPIC